MRKLTGACLMMAAFTILGTIVYYEGGWRGVAMLFGGLAGCGIVCGLLVAGAFMLLDARK